MSPVAEADPGKNMPKNIRDRNRSINVAHDLINDNGQNTITIPRQFHRRSFVLAPSAERALVMRG